MEVLFVLLAHSVILELNLPSYRLEASKRQISTALSASGLMVRQATGNGRRPEKGLTSITDFCLDIGVHYTLLPWQG